MLSKQRIEFFLGSLNARISLHVVEETASTNSDLKPLPVQALDKPFVLLANHQHAGRGQYERTWETEPGKNGICSIAYAPQRKDGMALLGLLVAVSIAETLEKFVPNLSAVIKWPNDVLIQHKKIAGILVETQFKGNQVEKVIIGFGVNINQDFSNSRLSETAASLHTFSDAIWEREQVVGEILTNFFQLIELWEDRDTALPGMINRRLIGFEQRVHLQFLQENRTETVWMCGVDEWGRLGALTDEHQQIWYEHEQLRIQPIG